MLEALFLIVKENYEEEQGREEETTVFQKDEQ